MSPILQREILSSVRGAALWWLRAAAAFMACLLFWWLAERNVGDPGQLGRAIFLQLNVAITLLLAGLAPALTADCVTRERRDGTLGLLFLTPLSAHQVILGKAQHHALRWLAVWLAVLPIALAPVAMGGVTIGDVGMVWTIQAASGMVGLTSGMLASATAKYRHQAWGLAYGTTLTATLLLAGGTSLLGIGFSALGVLVSPRWNWVMGWLAGSRTQMRIVNSPGFARSIFLFSAFLSLLVLAGLLGFLFLWLAGRLALQRWRNDEFEPPRELTLPRTPGLDVMAHLGDDWEEGFESLQYQVWRHGPGQRLRQRRPLEWLRLRERGRTELKGWWCALVFVAWVISAAAGNGRPAQLATLSLLFGICFRAARGYREESQNSTLELLLCTPLPLRDLLFSRVRLVFREFGLAVGLQLLLGLWLLRLMGSAEVNYPFHSLLIIVLMGAPAVGLLVAPRIRAFPLTIAATLGLMLGPPLFCSALGMIWSAAGNSPSLAVRWAQGTAVTLPVLIAAAICAWAWWRVAADFRNDRHLHALRWRRAR